LPDGNGLRLLDTIKKYQERAGVIIISAKNSLDDKICGLDLRADDYMTKPFHLSELNSRIKEIAEHLWEDPDSDKGRLIQNMECR
jgi:DNA-binding response OmpR family regulator